MTESKSNIQMNDSTPAIFRVFDISIIISCFLLIIWLYETEMNSAYLMLLFAVISLFLYLSESFQLYKKLRLGRFIRRILVVFASISLSFLLIISLMFLLKEGENFSRFVVASWYLTTLISMVLWRIIYRKIRINNYKMGINLRKASIIGMTPTGLKLADEIEKHDELGFKCIGFFDDRVKERLDGDLSKLQGNVEDAIVLAQSGGVDSLYICLPLQAQKRIASIIESLGDTTVNVFMVPDLFLNNLMQGKLTALGNIDTISVFDSPINGMRDFYKRSFDIAFSTTALILLSPILLAIALIIKLDSKGPVLFRQDRYGLDGKKIPVHKFRSMSVMENNDRIVQAKKGDTRITKVGAFLRKTSLDELPQFYDVLIGHMSVVGPRPHAVAHNELYRKQVTYYMLRHKVKPGITGLAQINGWRGETDTLEKMEKRIEQDLQYIKHWSLWLDIKIVLLTVFKGFINKNAY